MSGFESFERNLPVLLEDLAAPQKPDYFESVLGRTARTRQRPGWAFAERWLPMSALSQRLATAPRATWRWVAVAALLIVALAIGVALIVGSQHPRVPAPFGPAANGVIAFADDTGAIRAGSPGEGTSNVLVAGPGNERPVFSPDGTHLAYLHGSDATKADIVVVRADGSNPVVIATGQPLPIGSLTWTPDSASVVIEAAAGELIGFDAARASAPRTLVPSVMTGDGFNGSQVTRVYRPPVGGQVLYLKASSTGNPELWVANADGSAPRALVDGSRSDIRYSDLAAPQWSPDGSRIVFTAAPPDGSSQYKAYVVNADGTGLQRLSRLDRPLSEQNAAWSPDGNRVAIQRWFVNDDGSEDVRPVTVVDVASGAETEVGNISGNGFVGWAWSPDGKSLLLLPNDDPRHVVIADAATGHVLEETDWSPGSAPTWQREALSQ